MKTRYLLALLAGLSMATAPLAIAQRPAHSHAFVWDSVHGMRDLGTLGGRNSYALGINDSGEVVGYSELADHTTHAFTWTQAGGIVDLGVLARRNSTQAAAINSAGNIAGTGIGDGLFDDVPAFFIPPNTWIPLTAPSDYTLNFSFGINDYNQLTGQFYSGAVHAFFWDPATDAFVFLPIFPGGFHTVGNAINNSAHITGTGSAADGAFHALFWTRDGGTQDIGVLNGSTYTAGGAINDNDEVVGYNDPELAGFYWSQATGMLALQSLGGTMSPAFGINRLGMIAGYSSLPDGTTHATLWNDHTSVPQDLGSLGNHGNSFARGLNNRGQVVGYSDAR
jgi:probable HAF family extracellular repeat protein